MLKRVVTYGASAAVVLFMVAVWWYTTSLAESAREFVWFLTPMGEDNRHQPITEVAVKTGADVRAVANFPGKCSKTEGTEWHRASNEITSVVCVAGDRGKEIGVFYESGTYIVRVGDLGGIRGTEAASRSNFRDIFEII